MPESVRPSVLLRLDGVVYPGDLAVQAFARHVAAAVPAEQGRAVLAGMRGFLEDKPDLLGTGIDLAGAGLRDAQDGEQAVELLAAAAGLGTAQRDAARQAARVDVAASAWIIEPSDGLAEIVDAIAGRASLAVLSVPSDPAVGPVLEACGLADTVDRVVALPMGDALLQLLTGVDGAAGQLLVIGTRWAGELEIASGAGATTAMLDRYGRSRGTATGRAADLTGLLDIVRTWIATH